jgi:hypothetical protein
MGSNLEGKGMNKKEFPIMRIVLACSLISILFSSCQYGIPGGNPQTAQPTYNKLPTPTQQPMAEVFFAATIPVPLRPGETLVLSVIDDVTGLALNTTNHTMQSGDSLHYYIALPLVVNSILKYRYFRQGNTQIMEDTSFDSLVRYRLYYVGGPGEVMDSITGWSDSDFSGTTGRITGRVINSEDGNGLPDIQVSAGGNLTMTDSNGEFVLEGLVEGVHNLVTYSLDGRFSPFQQGAQISAGKRTPVSISMTPAPMVNVVFNVIVPENTVPTAPIRLAGNLYQMGNTFGDLRGGISGAAVRMPVLTPMLDGRFTLSLMLPVGTDIRYKYTLGDGFWNAEHDKDGSFVIRQLIVPDSGGVYQDEIQTWQAGKSAPILFEVNAPQDTPQTDIVSIQFNPYGWTEPIHMWPLGNNRWVYKLFSPFNMLGSFDYRYCRNDQCGSADDLATAGGARGRSVATSLIPQNIQDTITAWKWPPSSISQVDPGLDVQSRDAGFLAGIEFQSNYSPSWYPWMNQAMQDVQAIGANLVIITPTWTFQHEAPLVFSIDPGNDPLGIDVSEIANQATSVNLNLAMFPSVHLPVSIEQWWLEATRDAIWWESWFSRYRAFAIYYADLAMKNNVQMLILGGDWLGPALPGGILSDGSASNLPPDAEIRWSNIVDEVRQRYDGQIYWAIPYPGGLATAPGVINELDGIYLLWNAPLGITDRPSLAELQTEAGVLLDQEIYPIQNSFRKPMVISIAYPSIQSTSKGCIPDGNGGCLDWSALDQPSVYSNSMTLDLQAQMDAYNAILSAVDSRNWISGFSSRGYYPPVALQDPSASIHGKPAQGLLGYWYPRLLDTVKQP